MYGASAQLVITMKGGSVNGFTLVSSSSENWPVLKADRLFTGQLFRRIHLDSPRHANSQEASHLQCQ